MKLTRRKFLGAMTAAAAGISLNQRSLFAMEKDTSEEKFFLIEEAFQKAKEVLKKCSTEEGFYASPYNYNAVYARDGLITSLGALSTGEDFFIDQWLKTMNTLMKRQSPSGQIPNCVNTNMTPELVALGAADASLWFILSLAYGEKLLEKEFPEFHLAAEEALIWLKYQDAHEDGLIEQQEATDWMDIIANRGHVLYTNALYYGLLKLRGEKTADKIGESVKGFLWSNELKYFRSYAWKQEYGDWFDTAGNCFTIVLGLTDRKETDCILNYISENKLYEPYPVRTIHPPIQPGDKDWREYYRTEHELNMPDKYHNGGVWPWVGGLYVSALLQGGRAEEAEEMLYKLALANKKGREKEWEFNEWFHGITGEPCGSTDQAWSAGMYIYAYSSVKKEKLPVFSELKEF